MKRHYRYDTIVTVAMKRIAMKKVAIESYKQQISIENANEAQEWKQKSQYKSVLQCN